MSAELNIPLIDLLIIVSYLFGIVMLGILTTRKQKLNTEKYFLDRRGLGWGIIGAALFASNISTIHLVGLAASGYNEGLVWGNFEWMATFTLILLGIVFAPFYFKNKISTLPEFLEKRYSPGSRTFLAFMAIIGALFIHIGMSLYAGAAVFEQFFGIDVYTSIIVISVIAAIYTVLGGLKAVVVTESIQTVLLLIGVVLITLFAILELSSYGISAFVEFKAALKPDQLSTIHTDNSSGLAWYSVILGYPILGVWYWRSDQTIVQRVLGAKTERDAKFGPLFAGLLKILPVFILILPVVIAYVLFEDIIGSNSNQSLPVLINELIPSGLKGLLSAGLLAVLMSTIAAALKSSSTLVAIDIVKRIKPETTELIQVKIGRISVFVIMILAMIWSTQGGWYSNIFEAMNSITANFVPPITSVFILGVFWRSGTKQAAISTLIFGFTLGAIAFMLDLPVFGDTKIISNQFGIPFMMQAWWLFVLSPIFFVVVSFLTPEPNYEAIKNITWESPLKVFKEEKFSGLTDHRFLAGFFYYCY